MTEPLFPSVDPATRQLRPKHIPALPTSQVTDLPEFIRDTVVALIRAGANVIITEDDAGNALTINMSGSTMQLLSRSLWDGSIYPYKGTAITAARRTGDMAGRYIDFVGGPDPVAMGITINGDSWKEPAP